MKNTSVPIVGGTYSDDTKSWSAQDCVNWLPTQAEKEGTRTPSMLKTPPGLREFTLTPPAPTWVNAFDAGPCDVSIDGNLAAIFSHDFGTMAKGSTQTYSVPTTGYIVTVSVSSAGVVTASTNIGINTTYKLRVKVTPNAGMPSQAIRLNSIVITSVNPSELNSFYYPNCTSASINNTAGGNGFFSSQSPANPNPFDLTGLGGTRSWYGLQICAPTSVNIGVSSISFSPEAFHTYSIPTIPVRGVYNCEGALFSVIGNDLIRISTTGSVSYIGNIPGVSRVIMADNQISAGNELIVVNGSAGYVYNTRTGDFGPITDAGYPGAINAVFLGGYLVQIEPARRFAFNSAVADALSYNTLDRFTSEVSPDLLMSMAVTNNELILFSQRTTEFFEVTANTSQPFRTKGISMSRGCGGRYTVANMDNTVYWLGDDGIFYRLAGYSPQRISTRPIEQAIKGLNWDQAFAFTWENGGHKVCYWTFPDGFTWGYDVSANEWHRRASYGLDRWRVMGMTYWNNQWIAGDFQYGKLWVVDWDYHMEGDDKFISQRTTGVLTSAQNRVIVNRVEVIMSVGQESTDDDHYVRLQYSDDGGYNWSMWDQEDIGATGEYGKRMVFTRQGSTRNRTYRISCSSPRRRDLLGGAVVLQGTIG